MLAIRLAWRIHTLLFPIHCNSPFLTINMGSPKVKYSELNTDESAVLSEAVEATYAAVIGPDAVVASGEVEDDAIWFKEQRRSHQSLHWLRRPSIVMICICIFSFALATSSAEASRQFILSKLACNSVAAAGAETCDPVQAQVAFLNFQQAAIVAMALATIFALGKMGPLSDQYGRRIFIGLLIFVQMLGKLAKLGIMMSSNKLQFVPMVVAEFLSNICGGVITFLMLANCYVSDISEVHQRTFYLGLIMALFFSGMSLGPSVGNFLMSLGSSSPVASAVSAVSVVSAHEFLPLKVEIGLVLCLLLFVVLVLPESRTENARRMSRSLSHSLPRPLLVAAELPRRISLSLVDFLSLLRILAYPDDVAPPLRRKLIRTTRIAVLTLVACDCLLVCVVIAMGEIYIMYGIFQFEWTAKDMGVMLTVVFSLRAVTLLVVSPLLSHKLFTGVFGLRAQKLRFDRLDWAMIMTGYVAEVIGMLVLGLSTSAKLYLAVMGITSLGSLSLPAMASGLVKFFPELRMGEVFGAMTMVKNTLQIFVPFFFLNLYKKLVVLGYPQAVFYFMVFVYGICMVTVTLVLFMLDKEDARVSEEDSESVIQNSVVI